MKTKAIKAGFAISALALAMSPAMASEIRFDGFASFVGGQVVDDEELDASSLRGYTDKFGFQQNSIFALQARADLMEKLSATAQVTAKGSDGYEAKFNWAYLSYEINNEWSAKIGRSRIPYFMYSDFLDVGYAYHWISPPDAVYNLGGFDSADGISLDYQTDIGPWTSRLSTMIGRAETTISIEESTEADTTVADLWMVAWNMTYDWLTFRIVHAESELDIDVELTNQLSEGLQTFGVSQAALDEMLLISDRALFDGIAIALDNGSAFAVLEYTELGLTDSFAEDRGIRWYVSGGYRFGDFTAYATVERYESDIHKEERDTILNQYDQGVAGLAALQTQLGQGIAFHLSGAPGSDVTQVAALQAQYNQLAYVAGLAQDLRGGVVTVFNGTERDEDMYSIGLRYNFHRSACAKLEFMQLDDRVTDLQPQAVAIAVDLVY